MSKNKNTKPYSSYFEEEDRCPTCGKKGFLVDSYDGEISPIFYSLVKVSAYSEITERYLIMKEDGAFESSFLHKNSDDKIFSNELEAIQYSLKCKEESIKIYRKQVEYYQNLLNEAIKKAKNE